ncbi:pyruvate, phosphate dikinase [Candidatus Micrarchaeota archaeon]|nr:pyruvate, phosphate dikinase [Candidatus Micrarchaeota archaeon]
MSKKYVYSFEEGDISMKELLGGKGAGLAEMTKIGIPVPPGFTIVTEVCDYYYKHGNTYPPELKEQVETKLHELEDKIGKKFGDDSDPLLVSVRSGAAVSMPGMMDTILNLGLNDRSVEGLAKKTGNPRFAWDAYRRFIQMFGNVVMGIEHSKFEHVLEEAKKEKGVTQDTELDTEDLKKVVERYKQLVHDETGRDFPQDPNEQLWMAIEAVVKSWNNDRAIAYRKINNITGLLGTAVNVQAMVFGNMGETSGTGVAFTRNPATGEKKFYGEFLLNAQGEDVVAGIRTPQPVEKLKEVMPEVYDQLLDVVEKLEKHFRDMQDLEFTIQEGKLYLLQTRTGKRTAKAAVKIAVDMVHEGLITREEAIMRVDPAQIDQLLHPQIDPVAKQDRAMIAKGLPASPGAAVGKVVFTAEKAKEMAENGERVILVRTETSPEDIEGMHAAVGILTSRGGMTSHAAVVARGMGKCCVVGCEEITVYEDKGEFVTKSGEVVKEGDYITLDGNTGEVFIGQLGVIEPELSGEFAELMSWADEIRRLGVKTNADTPKDAATARKFGAEGIGLCRTEHMFFEEERIKAFREMILFADDRERRKKALDKIRPYQENDFYELFKVMDGYPVTIRLLDPPLHEFLPKTEEDMRALSEETGVSIEKIREKAEELHEFNPMLGHRGCRLAITYPEIAVMQTEAIIGAAIRAVREGVKVEPEIMIPLVGKVEELEYLDRIIRETADRMIEEAGLKDKLTYRVGTMIEIPRAALTADEIARVAEFFSFGTNDLTQMTFGYSRDDAGKFIKEYREKGILEFDPFKTLDQRGVGKLVKMAVELGRKTRPDIRLGICGEHGGDPASIDFCHRVGLDYVSSSPYRVPIARLAAAQAAIRNKTGQ